MALQERRAIRDPRLLTRSLIVLSLVRRVHAAGFLHLTPSIIALVGAGVMLLVADLDVEDVPPRGRVADAGVLHGTVRHGRGPGPHRRHRDGGDWALELFGDNHFAAATSLLFGSAILGAFVDNIPYVATMAPVVEGMAAAAPDEETGRALWWAFALGADFGGNGTAVAQRERRGDRHGRPRGYPISFWQFTRYGIVVTAAERRPCLGVRVVAVLHC